MSFSNHNLSLYASMWTNFDHDLEIMFSKFEQRFEKKLYQIVWKCLYNIILKVYETNIVKCFNVSYCLLGTFLFCGIRSFSCYLVNINKRKKTNYMYSFLTVSKWIELNFTKIFEELGWMIYFQIIFIIYNLNSYFQILQLMC